MLLKPYISLSRIRPRCRMAPDNGSILYDVMDACSYRACELPSLPLLVCVCDFRHTRTNVRVLQAFHPTPIPLLPSLSVNKASCDLQVLSYTGVPRTMPEMDDFWRMPIHLNDTSQWSEDVLREKAFVVEADTQKSDLPVSHVVRRTSAIASRTQDW